jgi:hypothetical protein
MLALTQHGEPNRGEHVQARSRRLGSTNPRTVLLWTYTSGWQLTVVGAVRDEPAPLDQ